MKLASSLKGIVIVLAAVALTGCGTDKSVSKEIKLLKSSAAEDRVNGLVHLRVLGKKAGTASKKVVASLEDSDVRVRHAAIECLGSIADTEAMGEELVEALSKSARGDESDVNRLTAALTLKRVGANDEYKQALSLLLLSSIPHVQRDAAMYLSQAGDPPAGALDGLMAMLTHSDSSARYYAVTVLGDMGSNAQSASDALKGLRKDKDATVKLAAKQALTKIN